MTVFLVLLWVTIIFLRPYEYMATAGSFAEGRTLGDIPVLVQIQNMTGFLLVEIVAILALATWLISLAAGKKKFTPGPQNLAIAGFLGAVALSYLTQFWFGGAFAGLQDFGKVALLFLILASVIDSEKKLKLSMALLVILVGVLAAQGINQYYAGEAFGGQSMFRERIRGTGIFSDPNDLAQILVVSMPLGLSLIAGRGWSGPVRLIGIATLPLVFVALYFTNSRGGIISLIVVLILYFRAKLGWKKGLILGAASALVVFFYSPSRMAELSLADDSAGGRIQGWYQGLLLIKSNPLTGVGYAASNDYYGAVAHNSFLTVGSELGLIGLFFWVALIYFAFKSIYQWSKAPPSEMKSLSMDLSVSLAGFLGAAMFLSRSYSVVLFMLLALIIAAQSIGHRRGLVPILKFELRDITRIMTIEFAGFISIYAFMYLL